MQKYNTIYYLLFVLLVMGSFASMAQNDYGVIILGLVAAGFSLIFLIQLVSHVSKKGMSNWHAIIELASLSILAAILTLRIFYVHFEFVEYIFGIAGIILIVVYLLRIIDSRKSIPNTSKNLGLLIVLFYSSIVFYLSSMITVAFFPSLAEPSGGVAFALILVFVALGVRKSYLIDDGEKVSAINYVSKFKDRSVVLIFLFLLFTAYMGLTKIGVLPKMYSDEYPQAYFELVKRAESGKEKPVDGKFKHEEFKEYYSRFVEKPIESR